MPATNGIRATDASHAQTLPSVERAMSAAVTGASPTMPSRSDPDRIASVTASRPVSRPAGRTARTAIVPKT